MAFTLLLLSLLVTSCLAQHFQTHSFGDHDDHYDRENDFGLDDDYYEDGPGGFGGRGGGDDDDNDMATARLVDDQGNKFELSFKYDYDNGGAGGGRGPGGPGGRGGPGGPGGFGVGSHLSLFGGHGHFGGGLDLLNRHNNQQNRRIHVTGKYYGSETGQKLQGEFKVYITKYGNTAGNCAGLGPLFRKPPSGNQGFGHHGGFGGLNNPLFGGSHGHYGHFGLKLGGGYGGYGGFAGHGLGLGRHGFAGSPYGPRPQTSSQYVGLKAKLHAYAQYAAIDTYLTNPAVKIPHLVGRGVTVCINPPGVPENPRNPCQIRTDLCGSIVRDRYSTEDFKQQLKKQEFYKAYHNSQQSGGAFGGPHGAIGGGLPGAGPVAPGLPGPPSGSLFGAPNTATGGL